MAKVSSSKLHLQFAKAKEAEGRYAEAAVAYEAAGDMDSVVRLSIDRLNAPTKAYAIVRRTRSVEAAALLTRWCLQAQDFAGAVEFLLLAGQMDQAFDIAQGHSEMDTFARIVQSQARACCVAGRGGTDVQLAGIRFAARSWQSQASRHMHAV
eukprot:98506-Chlamydomonas_euryale.AAC.1